MNSPDDDYKNCIEDGKLLINKYLRYEMGGGGILLDWSENVSNALSVRDAKCAAAQNEHSDGAAPKKQRMSTTARTKWVAGALGGLCVVAAWQWTERRPGTQPSVTRARESTAPGAIASDGLSDQEVAEFVGFLEPVVDLGEVPWATERVIGLAFANHGQQPLTIGSVESTCGCTLVYDASAYAGRVVEPGDALVLEITMSTGDRPGVKHAYVQLRASDGRIFGTAVHARVVGTWDLSADLVSFGKVFLDEPGDAVAHLVFSSQSERLAGTPQPSVDWLACSVRESEADRAQVEIELRVVKDRLSPGTNSGVVKVTATDSQVTTRGVAVSAIGVPALMPYSAHLVLLPGTSGTVRFFDQGGERAELVSLDVGDAPLQGRLSGQGSLELSAGLTCAVRSPATVYVTDRLGRRGRLLVSVLSVR